MYVRMITKGSLCGTLSLQLDGKEQQHDAAFFLEANRITGTEGLIFINPSTQNERKLLEVVQGLFPIVIWTDDNPDPFPPQEVYRYARWIRLERKASEWSPTPANEVIITGERAKDPLPYKLNSQELFIDVSKSNADFVQRALEKRIRMCPTTIQYSEREINVQEIYDRQKQSTVPSAGSETVGS